VLRKGTAQRNLVSDSQRPDNENFSELESAELAFNADNSDGRHAIEAEGESVVDENIESDGSQSVARSVARATVGIGALHLVQLLLGFAAKPILANRIGLLASADALTVATDIVTSVWRFWEKVVNPTVLPCFIGALKTDGEERAWRFLSTAFWLTVLTLLLVTPLIYVLMPPIVDLYSDKASAEQRELTVALGRLMLTGLTFLGISSLTYVILNGYKRFFSAALGDTLWKMGVLVGAGFAIARNLDPVSSIYLISWGFVLGSFFKLLPHLIALRGKWHLLRPRLDLRDPLVTKMLWLAVPLLVGIVVSEGRDVFIKRLADSPEIAVAGSRTALNFSRTIGDALLKIFPYALSIGLFPYLAGLAQERDRQPLTETLIGALRVCFFAFAPITMLLIVLRFPLLRAVWESGQFKQADTFIISLPFVFYALGLVGFASEMMLNQTFYALTNVWAPTLVGLFTTLLWCAGAHWAVTAGGGLAALAATESLAKSVKCVLLWFLLRRHLGAVRARDNLIFVAKVLAASALAAIVAYYLGDLLAPRGEVLGKIGKIKMLGSVAVAGLTGVGVFFGVAILLRIEETRAVGGLWLKLKGKIAR
jgi:putative peptidoglycan lipid II flippase